MIGLTCMAEYPIFSGIFSAVKLRYTGLRTRLYTEHDYQTSLLCLAVKMT